VGRNICEGVNNLKRGNKQIWEKGKKKEKSREKENTERKKLKES
jgi:hypothetical protein